MLNIKYATYSYNKMSTISLIVFQKTICTCDVSAKNSSEVLLVEQHI